MRERMRRKINCMYTGYWTSKFFFFFLKWKKIIENYRKKFFYIFKCDNAFIHNKSSFQSIVEFKPHSSKFDSIARTFSPVGVDLSKCHCINQLKKKKNYEEWNWNESNFFKLKNSGYLEVFSAVPWLYHLTAKINRKFQFSVLNRITMFSW